MNSHEARVLILSNPSDSHSFAVEAGLRAKGVSVQIWHTADWPTLQVGSFTLGSSEPTYEIRGPELTLRNEAITSVWARRPLPPSLPTNLDPSDRDFAFRENSLFVRSLNDLVGANAFVVNPPSSHQQSMLRTAQLRTAINSGFRIPRTLCSNNPDAVREFIQAMPRGVIFKSFFPMIWETDRGRAVLFTQQVQIEDLSEESSLRASPGIFQELIPKAYELRVTAIGRRLFAAKLRSQEVEPAQLDYRAALDEVPIEPYELPLEVSEACLRVLEGLGLVFGCFDLIVTPTGEYVFLEVNEMGAFLWIEERLPEMRLLDAFCELLTQGRPDFIWEGRNSIRAADFDQIVETQLATSPTIHVAGERKVAKDTA